MSNLIQMCARGARLLRNPLLALYVVNLMLSSWMALREPVWSYVDESWHYDVVAQFAAGVVPRVGSTPIRAETAALDAQTHVYTDRLIGPSPDPARAPYAPPPAGISSWAQGIYNQRHAWELSDEALQPPTYYLAATPVYLAARRLLTPLQTVYALRLFQCCIVAMLAPLTYLLAKTLTRGREACGIVAGLVVATMPGLLLNTTSFTNDAATAVVGVVFVLVACRGVAGGWTRARLVWLGLVFSLGFLVKPSFVGLGPALVLAPLVPTLLPADWRQRARRLLLVLTGAAVGPIAWIGYSEALYRATSTYAPSRVLSTVDPLHGSNTAPFGAHLIANINNWFDTLVRGEPLTLTSRVVPDLRGWYLAIVVLALAGGTAALVQRRPRFEIAVPSVVAAAILGQLAFATLLPVLGGDGYLTPARYTFAAVGPLAALVGASVAGVTGSSRLLVAISGCVVLVPVATINFYGGVQRPVGTGPDRLAAAHVSPVDFRTAIGPVVIWADQFAQSADAHYLHVTIRNASGSAVEWTPLMAIRTADQFGLRPVTDYLASTPFPERVEPHSTEAGWFRLAEDAPVYATPTTVFFPNVAGDNYRFIADVPMTVNLVGLR